MKSRIITGEKPGHVVVRNEDLRPPRFAAWTADLLLRPSKPSRRIRGEIRDLGDWHEGRIAGKTDQAIDLLNLLKKPRHVAGFFLSLDISFYSAKLSSYSLPKWWGRGDLNPRASRHQILSLARLPVPPRPQFRTGSQ